jgi:hypothetical protein
MQVAVAVVDKMEVALEEMVEEEQAEEVIL